MPIPIPRNPSGFTLGDVAATAKIDVFFDIQCPHSKRAWPTIIEFVEHYKPKPVSVTAHIITLSNHRQAWDMSLALFSVADGDPAQFFEFASFLFERQDQFYNAPFLHKTHHDLRELAADFANQYSGVEKASFLEKMRVHLFALLQRVQFGQHPLFSLTMPTMCRLSLTQRYKTG